MSTEPTPDTTGGSRSFELEVEVPGTPEEVWRAVATGPGMSSWYVPTTVEEHEGGATTSRFGEGPEGSVPGRVATWEPPHRVVFAGDPGMGGLAFEWLIEARDGGSCVVRLINSGFGEGPEWDGLYDGLLEGWPLFLENLRLHLQHFADQSGHAMVPSADLGEDAWARLTAALGWPADPAVGDRVTAAKGAPTLSGTVATAGPTRVWLRTDQPAPGTALVAVEGTLASVWGYFYGDDADQVAAAEGPRWRAWLDALA